MTFRLPSRLCGLAPLLLVLALGAAAQTAAAPSGWKIAGQLNQSYSNNITGSLLKPFGDTGTQMTLELQRSWASPRSSFQLTYTPEGMSYIHNHILDYFSQSYSQMWTYQSGPHSTWSWNLNAARYPERGGAPGLAGGGLTGVQMQSQSLALQTVMTLGGSGLSFTHQASARASWTAGVNGSWLLFQNDAALAPLQGSSGAPQNSQTRSASGNVDWSYLLNPDYSLTVSVAESDNWFLPVTQHQRNVNSELSLTRRIGSNVQLEAGGGPAKRWDVGTRAPGSPSVANGMSYAAHAGVDETLGTFRLGLTWNHSDQPSFIPGSITTDALAVTFSQSWNRRWQFQGSVGSSRNSTLFTNAKVLSGAFANTGLSYILAGWALHLDGAYFSQDVVNLQDTLSPLNRMQVSAGISYSFPGVH